MSYKHNPLMEPIFFTPPGSKRRYKGGGSTGTYYENQDKLLGVQADIATNMYNQYAEKGAPLLASLSDKAAAGVDPEKYAGQAAADAQSANANERDTTIRNMSRMGMNPASGNFQSVTADNTLKAAANTAGAQNSARRDAEKLDWAHKSDVAAMYSGMPGQATQSLASAAGGYGQMAGQQNQMAMANAQGYGAVGAMGAKMAFAKDGGFIRREPATKNGEPRFAMGGMPTLGDWRQRPSSVRQGNGTSPLESVISGAVPIVAGQLAKPYLAQAGSALKEGVGKAFGQGRNALERAAGVDQTQAAAPYLDKSTQVADAAGGVPADASAAMAKTGDLGAGASTTLADTLPGAQLNSMDLAGSLAKDVTNASAEGLAKGMEGAAGGLEGAVPYGSIVGGLASVANGGDVGDAALGAAKSYAGTQIGAAIGSVIPGLGTLVGGTIGGLASGLIELADGGEVVEGRQDMRGGGHVSGPGTTTSDDIPAWLSDKEYVLNAEATALIGKDKLDALNSHGLKMREKGRAQKFSGGGMPITPDVFSSKAFGQDAPGSKFDPLGTAVMDMFSAGGQVKKRACEPRFFLGGMAGVAMGAGVNQWNQLEQQDLQKKANERADKSLALQQEEAVRRSATHDLEMKEKNLKLDQTRQAVGDAADLRKISDRQEGDANLATAIKGNGGTADSYLAATQGTDPATGERTPFTPEQERTIRTAAGLALNPFGKYQLDENRATILGRSNPDAAAKMTQIARKEGWATASQAVRGSDGPTVTKWYNALPNGDTVENISFDGDNAIIKRKGQPDQTMTKKEMLRQGHAFADPAGADKLDNFDEKLAAQAQQHSYELRIKEERLKLAQEKQAGGGSGGGDSRKDAASIFGEAQKIVTGEDGKTDGERLGPINAMAQNLYRSGQATSPGEAVMLAKDRLANAEFSPTRAIARAQQDLEQIKKTQNVTGALNPTGNSWSDVSKQLTGKSVSEEQFIKDRAQGYINNGRSAPAPAQGQPAANSLPPDGTQGTGLDGKTRFEMRGGKAVPLTPEAIPQPNGATENSVSQSGVRDGKNIFGIRGAIDKSDALNEDRASKYTASLLSGSMTAVKAKEILKNVEKTPALVERLGLTAEQIANLKRAANQ